jgi:hypothetical protein
MAEAVTAVGTAVLVFVAFGQLVMFYWQLPQNVEAGAAFEPATPRSQLSALPARRLTESRQDSTSRARDCQLRPRGLRRRAA